MVRSELVKTNKIYDIVEPQTSVEYSNKYKMEGSNMVLNKCLLYEGEEGPNLKVGQQWRKLGLGRWKDHGDFNFLRVKIISNAGIQQDGTLLAIIRFFGKINR